jgi:hypothetical protein
MNELLAKFHGLNESAVNSQIEILKCDLQAAQHRMTLFRVDLLKGVELIRALKAGQLTLEQVTVNDDGTWSVSQDKETPAATVKVVEG